MLLKFIFGPAFHLSLQRNNCFTLQLLLRSEIWNSTKVLKDAPYGVLGFVVAMLARHCCQSRTLGCSLADLLENQFTLIDSVADWLAVLGTNGSSRDLNRGLIWSPLLSRSSRHQTPLVLVR